MWEIGNAFDDLNDPLYENVKREKGYEKLCKGCSAVTPEAMKFFIADEFDAYDEVYYCQWCNFIQATGIDDLLVVKKEENSEAEDYEEDYEDDGMDALWELEDAGAFSDEGIMPGCHSNDWYYDSEVRGIMQEFKDMAFVGECIQLAREKAGLSVEALANELEIPESFIHDIEQGEYISRYGNSASMEPALPVSVVAVPVPVKESECTKEETERPWWQDCNDDRIKEKIADYISTGRKPIKSQTCGSNYQVSMEDCDDEPPF